MAWEIIMGIDPRFTEVVREEMGELPIDALEFFPIWQFEKEESCILLRNPEEKKLHRINYSDAVVKPLSAINLLDYREILRLLQKAPEQMPQFSLWNLKTASGDTLMIWYQISLITDEAVAEPLASVCQLQVLSETKGLRGHRNGTYAIYLDKSLPGCYDWFREFEDIAQTLLPKVNVVFHNQVGICEGCKKPLAIIEHDHQLFLCTSCKVEREMKEAEAKAARELLRKELLAQGKRFKDLKTMITCAGCGQEKLIPQTRIKPRQDRYYCDRTCSDNALREKYVAAYTDIHCSYCDRKRKRKLSEVQEKKRHFCDYLCRVLFRSTQTGENTIYTLELLAEMKKYNGFKGNLCAFPGCDSVQAPLGRVNKWHACRRHAALIYSALSSRKRSKLS